MYPIRLKEKIGVKVEEAGDCLSDIFIPIVYVPLLLLLCVTITIIMERVYSFKPIHPTSIMLIT